MARSRILFTEVPPTSVVSFLQCDARSINWSICVKVIGHFWDIPPMRMHRQMTYNAVLKDAEVTPVYGMADIVVHGENENQFNFEIMDERGSAAFWALDSYSRVRNKDDVVVALLWVEMKRLSDGDILFSSHCDLSKAHFNYHHPAVIDFRSKLNRAIASQEDDSSDSTTS